MDATPTLCRLEHPGFASLKRPMFRLTEGDAVPALALDLDGNQAVIPLTAAAKLFGITSDSADGRMLALIGSALRFVVCLRPDDPLPAEVLSGKASWEPAPRHHRLAALRLQLLLVQWIGAASTPITMDMLLADDPAARPLIQDALRHAAQELGLKDGAPSVTALIEDLATELSYMEALREQLLERVQSLLRRLVQLARGTSQVSAARRETLVQVTRLTATGLAQIAALFDQVDSQTADIITALRNLDQQRSFLRPNRDWLHCTHLAWDAELREWDAIPPNDRGEHLWRLVDRLYRFVAPRFMPVQEWQKLDAQMTTEHAKATFMW